MARVVLLVGTKKGAFLLESNADRRNWEVRGPFCEGWPVYHVAYDTTSGSIYGAGNSPWFGAAVWRSHDGGETWAHSSQGLTFGDGGPKLEKVWNLTPAHGVLYAGTDPAALFRSDDGGESFVHVEGLTNHHTRAKWESGNGGLCLHSIVPHPYDPKQLWVAASAVGTFYTADGGATWETLNSGVRNDYFPPEMRGEVGYCVHKIAQAPGMPNRLYQQSHLGVYRSDDSGRTWEWITEGLPSTFGFPLAVHPHDPNTAYVIPLNDDGRRFMPDGRAAVWRTRDAGASWERLDNGLPQTSAFVTVLREAMATDTLAQPGIYFGTSTGQVFASPDEGNTWLLAADFLPPIYSVEAAVIG